MYARFVATLGAGVDSGALFWATFTGIAFVAAAISIGDQGCCDGGGAFGNDVFFLWVVLLHIPRVAGAIRNGNEVTSLFVAVAMSDCLLFWQGVREKSGRAGCIHFRIDGNLSILRCGGACRLARDRRRSLLLHRLRRSLC